MSSSSRVRRLAAVMQGLCDGGIDPEVEHRTPVALVIGAGSGIGQAVATKFAKVSESVWAECKCMHGASISSTSYGVGVVCFN